MEIDIVALEGAIRGKAARGIYDLRDDSLTLCYVMPPAQERPKEFASKPGSGSQLTVWKRAAE